MTVLRQARPRRVPARGSAVRAYVALTKPRIIELLLVTTVPAMVLAQGGVPSVWLVLGTLVGGTLAAASANTLNCYFDRDIDARMHRTRRRPLAATDPAYVVSPRRSLVFAVVLAVVDTALLGFAVNWLAAALADAAIVFYIAVYTLGLKRRTASNIVIGGAAGCFPALVGWAAVTGGIGLPALLLAAVVFVWTPPHFWALAMRYRDDYARAGVPMLPVVAGPDVVTRKILAYAWTTVAVSLTLIPYAGPVYGACAAALGVWLLASARRLRAEVTSGRVPRPMDLFHVTNSYLALLFVAVVVGVLLRP
jgi:heme o synthase